MSRYYVSVFLPPRVSKLFRGISAAPPNKKTAPIQEAVSKKNLSRFFAAGAAGI